MTDFARKFMLLFSKEMIFISLSISKPGHHINKSAECENVVNKVCLSA